MLFVSAKEHRSDVTTRKCDVSEQHSGMRNEMHILHCCVQGDLKVRNSTGRG